MNWPFGDLVPLGYDLIMADPPWSFQNYSEAGERKNAKHHYRCLPLQEIMALPVSQLAARDCALWLWATPPMLDRAFDVMRAWHFTFKTSGHWCKRTEKGHQPMGTGYIMRNAGDPFLIGTIGAPTFAKNIRNTFDGVRREHTRKPLEAFDMAERLVPGAMHRCELFAWTPRPGWAVWGDQVGRYGVDGPAVPDPAHGAVLPLSGAPGAGPGCGDAAPAPLLNWGKTDGA